MPRKKRSPTVKKPYKVVKIDRENLNNVKLRKNVYDKKYQIIWIKENLFVLDSTSEYLFLYGDDIIRLGIKRGCGEEIIQKTINKILKKIK